MQTTRWMLPMFLVTGLAAQDRDAEREPEPIPMPKLMAAGDMIGATVKNASGIEIGTVDDLVLDRKNSRVTLAVVSTGGFLGVGDVHTAVPCSVLKWRNTKKQGKYLILATDKKKLAAAPKFDNSKLYRHLADPNFRKETEAVFGAYPEGTVIAAREATSGKDNDSDDGKKGEAKQKKHAPRFLFVSKLDDLEVRTRVYDIDDDQSSKTHHAANRGESFGSVSQVLIHTKDGTIGYAVVARGGVAGIGADRFVVPWSALEMCPEQRLHLQKTKLEMNEAPKLKKDAVLRLANEEFSERIHSFYDES